MLILNFKIHKIIITNYHVLYLVLCCVCAPGEEERGENRGGGGGGGGVGGKRDTKTWIVNDSLY